MSFVKRYARFVSHNPVIILAIVALITTGAFYFSGKVGTKSMDNRNMIPDDLEVINSFNIIEDNFGGSDTIMIAVEIDPDVHGSDEIRDLRDPRAIKYLSQLTQLSAHTDEVISANSAADILIAANNGILPESQRRVIDLSEKLPQLSQYISADYTLAIVSIRLSDGYDEQDILNDLNNVIMQVPMPPGLSANVAGDVAARPIMEQAIGPDMERTSKFSLIGILVILFMVFLSVRYSLTPLAVLGLGVVWTFGFFGLMGMSLSPATSGAISMIMGIGIDFGIQTLVRFRHELKIVNDPTKAMETTISNVFIPMSTTTISALIGFQAMSMGDLSFMRELGTMMSYGIFFCFISAMTVIPVITIFGEKIAGKIKVMIKIKKNKGKDPHNKRR